MEKMNQPKVNVSFKTAWELLKAGEKVKRAHWDGYWAIENGTIMMHCKDGSVIDIKDMEDVVFTFDEMAADDWQVAGESNSKLMAGALTSTFTFGEAVRMLKAGKKVARRGWNGKGMFVVYQKGYPQGIPCNKQTAEAWGLNEGDLFVCNPYLQIKNVNGSHSMWVPSINDCLAADWEVVA